MAQLNRNTLHECRIFAYVDDTYFQGVGLYVPGYISALELLILRVFFHGHAVKQLNGQDASFLYMETQHAHLHLTSVNICDRSTVDGGMSGDSIRQYIKSRMHTWPVFRQKLEFVPLNLDYPYWVDDEQFDPDVHIEQLVLPKPGDWHQFCNVVNRIHSEPLDLSRPPWDMHIVEGLDSIDGIPADAFAIVSRYHHAALDGASGTAILDGLYSTNPAHDADPQEEPREPQPGPTWLRLLNRAALNGLRVPLQLTRTVAGTIPGIGRSVLRNVLEDSEPADEVPKTRFNSAVSPQRVFDAVPFPLKQLAGIRKAVPGATVNDVILAICGGTLRAYLAAKKELPDESLVAVAPINTRTAADADTIGNVIATMFVPIFTDLDDPLSRLRAIQEVTSDAKEATGAVSPRQMTDLAQNIPAATEAIASWLITGLGIGYRMKPLANCTVSNVPGPQQPLYLNGARMVRMMGIGPILDGVGLMFAALSYNGEIVLTISGCREITPDPEVMADCLRSAYAELRKAVSVKQSELPTRARSA
ncbi:MAG: wax ester/triacylglycerol synthase family O-acyltransferase [Gammaproteobacteria bacterium]|nr:wax ester/triacylglycerol synthase family O-acyltransferase [Gammaproteobacteria bacterium]